MRRFQVTRKHVQIIYSYSIVLTPSKTHTTVSKPETSPQSSWCYPDNCCHNIEWIYFFFFLRDQPSYSQASMAMQKSFLKLLFEFPVARNRLVKWQAGKKKIEVSWLSWVKQQPYTNQRPALQKCFQWWQARSPGLKELRTVRGWRC